MVWTPLLALPALDGFVRAAVGTELDREKVESVAAQTFGFAADLVDTPEFDKAPTRVNSLGLGGRSTSLEVAQLHSAAHLIVGDTIAGLKDDLEHFAAELTKAVAAVDDADELSAAALLRIAEIDQTHHADESRQNSQNQYAPPDGQTSKDQG